VEKYCSGLFFKKERTKILILSAEVEEGASTRTPSIKTVYLHQEESTFALKFEPWILDTANSFLRCMAIKK